MVGRDHRFAGAGNQGARSVTTNFRELEHRGFIVIKRGAKGYNSTVRLLTETPPHNAYALPAKTGETYFRVSERLWMQSTIGELDGPALAMFLILSYYFRAETHQRDGVWFGKTRFAQRHGLSEETRNKGLKKLVELGVANMQETFYDVKDEDRGFRNLRRRTYRLEPVYWPPRPQPNPRSDSSVTVASSTELDRLPDPWDSSPGI